MTNKKTHDEKDQPVRSAAAEKRLQEIDQNSDSLADKVADVAAETSGVADQPHSEDGTPLTSFEVGQVERFATQNEIEEEIDQIEPSEEAKELFAGTDVNVGQTADVARGSATVTSGIPGETIQPYPPTDYAHLKITSTDLTNNPNFGTLGLVVGDPFPPENLFEDARETDLRNDTKDYLRRLRLPDDLIVESRRTKYAGAPQEDPSQAPSAT